MASFKPPRYFVSTNESSTGTKNDVVNFIDQLYIHLSNNIVTSIVNIKLTGAKNFRVWHSSMIRSLKARNRLRFLDGSIRKESNDQANSL